MKTSAQKGKKVAPQGKRILSPSNRTLFRGAGKQNEGSQIVFIVQNGEKSTLYPVPLMYSDYLSLFHTGNIFIGSVVYNRVVIVHKRQNFLWVVVHVIVIDQCNQTVR